MLHNGNCACSLQREKHNTYLLALDGDTDFQPAAVMLLIDRLKMYPRVGAACGRIHPTGSGGRFVQAGKPKITFTVTVTSIRLIIVFRFTTALCCGLCYRSCSVVPEV